MNGFTCITLVDKIKDDKFNVVSVLAFSRQAKYSGQIREVKRWEIDQVRKRKKSTKTEIKVCKNEEGEIREEESMAMRSIKSYGSSA